MGAAMERWGLGESEVQRRAVGWRSDGGRLAVYGGRACGAQQAGARVSKRQPVGTGRRWTGACGLIPVRGGIVGWVISPAVAARGVGAQNCAPYGTCFRSNPVYKISKTMRNSNAATPQRVFRFACSKASAGNLDLPLKPKTDQPRASRLISRIRSFCAFASSL